MLCAFHFVGLRSFWLKLICVPKCNVSSSQAAKDIAEVLSKSRNVVYMPNTGNMLMQMPSN